MTVLSETAAHDIARRVLEFATGADEAEAVVSSADTGLTRFANNGIHQNVSEESVHVNLRLALGKRVGVADGNQVDSDSLRRLAERAASIARLQPENTDFAGLPSSGERSTAGGLCPGTLEFSPEDRADGAAKVVNAARARGLTAFGAFSTGAQSVAVASTAGIRQYHQGTTANANAVLMSDDASGTAMALSSDVADIDMESIGEAAARKAERGASPEDIEPGTYQVVLEETAVAQMVEFLAFESFNGLFHEEGRSFTSSSMGKAVMGGNISIWDDGIDQSGIASPFDGEGVARERVDFIENGVLKAVVYDHQTASKYGAKNTGHAWTAPNPYGPVASNLFMAPGEADSVEELVGSVERGVWVSTFHYTNLLEPMRVVLTGMTRHGAFMIENGKVTKPLRNLRFTQSVLDAFSAVEGLTRDTKLTGDYLRVRAPAVLIREFQFTGGSQS